MTQEYFEMFGVTCAVASTSDECLEFLKENSADIFLLDINLGNESGFALCKTLREKYDTPILFISARQSDDDVLVALNIGGDDYIKKPFDNDELLARVSAALRRAEVSAAPDATREATSEAGDFTFASFRVEAKGLRLIDARGRVKDLFVNEYKMLRHLARHPGEAVSRDELLKVLWEDETYFGTTHSIDQAICRLRAKLGPAGACIETVYRAGYRYVPPK